MRSLKELKEDSEQYKQFKLNNEIRKLENAISISISNHKNSLEYDEYDKNYVEVLIKILKDNGFKAKFKKSYFDIMYWSHIKISW